MKRFLKFILVALVIGLIALWFLGRDVREVRTEIEIVATPEEVWAVVSDIDNWEAWSPIIKEAQGSLKLGATLDMTMVDKDGAKGANYAPIITVLEEGQAFRWRAKMVAEPVFTNEKLISLEAIDGGTKVVHSEFFSGMMAPLMDGMLETGVRPMLERMNDALKAVVEGGN